MENNKESRGVILFNKGTGCIVRAIVMLYTLRQHYDGPVTFYVESTPVEFYDVLKFFNCDIVENNVEDKHVLVRKTEMFTESPYDRTLWIDLDTVILGNIDEMFDSLDEYDCSIPNFCDWISTGRTISGRIKQFKGLIEQKYIDIALNDFPAINTGVLSFVRSDNWCEFVKYWVEKATVGAEHRIFIPDEVMAQILFPSMSEWGLKCNILDKKYNVSVKYGLEVEDKRVVHFHGKKHVGDFPLSHIWKDIFDDMLSKNIANIKSFLKYADKRLSKYLESKGGLRKDVTIVTACDNYYVDILRETYPNWRKYKHVDNYPVIVFVNGLDLNDTRLDFLRLPNVKMIYWDMPEIESQREKMLNCFVFGTAEHVKTDYWLKLDADSYGIDSKPLFSEEMKQYAFCGHKWTYSRPEHIKKLDEWAKNHWRGKLKNAKPMLEEGRVDGNRFFHNKKRTISFIQLHKTKFTKFCVSLLKERRLPAPTQDTYMFYVCDRFDPQFVGVANFKRDHGFVQGKGKLGAEHIRSQIANIKDILLPQENKTQQDEDRDPLDSDN